MNREAQLALLKAAGRYIRKQFATVEPRLKAIESRVDVTHAVAAEALAAKAVKGEKGDPGEPGKTFNIDEVRSLLEAECAKWALDFERRAQDTLQRSLDRMPRPEPGKDGRDGVDGQDGADGLGFDDLTVEHDGERGVTLKFVRGDRVKEFKFEIPSVIDRGFWKDGAEVRKGDGMTHGGSYWIAQTETKSKPELGNPDWRLAVKKGRDGRDGDKGERGPQGEKGLPGLNGRDLR